MKKRLLHLTGIFCTVLGSLRGLYGLVVSITSSVAGFNYIVLSIFLMLTTTVFPLLRGMVCNYCKKACYWFLLCSTFYFFWCQLLLCFHCWKEVSVIIVTRCVIGFYYVVLPSLLMHITLFPVAERNCLCYGCNICRCCCVWIQSSFQRVLSFILWWAISTFCSRSLGLLETTGTKTDYDPESMITFGWIYFCSLYWLLLRRKAVALTAKVEVPYFWAKLSLKTYRAFHNALQDYKNLL